MQLIATYESFSRNDQWTTEELFKHGARFRLVVQDWGLGNELLGEEKSWLSPQDADKWIENRRADWLRNDAGKLSVESDFADAKFGVI